MPQTVSRHEMQGAVDYARKTILDQMVSKNNLQAMTDQLRTSILQNLNELHAENQQLFRQSQARREQLMNRVASLESQLAQMVQLLNRILEQQAKTQAMITRR